MGEAARGGADRWNGGTGNDLVWPVTSTTTAIGGNGSDCLLLDFGAVSSSFIPHCGNDPDSYYHNGAIPSSLRDSCETRVSKSVCQAWVP